MNREDAVPRATESSSEKRPLPSDDQRFFEESQRVGIRAMGEILRKRRKAPRAES